MLCAEKCDSETLANAIAMYDGREDAAEAVAEAKVVLSRLIEVALQTL